MQLGGGGREGAVRRPGCRTPALYRGVLDERVGQCLVLAGLEDRQGAAAVLGGGLARRPATAASARPATCRRRPATPDSKLAGIQAPVARVAMVPSPSPLYHSSLQPLTGRQQLLVDELLPGRGELGVPASAKLMVTLVPSTVYGLPAGLPDHAGGEAGVAGVVGDVRRSGRRCAASGRPRGTRPRWWAPRCRTCRRPPCCRTAPSGRSPWAGRRCRRRRGRSSRAGREGARRGPAPKAFRSARDLASANCGSA